MHTENIQLQLSIIIEMLRDLGEKSSFREILLIHMQKIINIFIAIKMLGF
jgi:hypothetical protein